jgi:hypothetical protein
MCAKGSQDKEVEGGIVIVEVAGLNNEAKDEV